MRTLSLKGDTIVEVILAMALLTSVLLIAWGTTNRAVQIQQTALDRTTMVNAVKEQAEIIKVKWSKDPHFFDSYTSSVVSDLIDKDPCKETSYTNAWYLDAGDDSLDLRTGVKTVNSDTTKHVWVRKVIPNLSSGVPATDFYIRACWQSQVGGGQTDEHTQVLLRLNI